MEQLSISRKLAPIEVLFVVLVCMFLLGILSLACRKSRSFESQMTCGVNLSSIGRAIQIYATDYDGEFPRAGSKSSVWGKMVSNWLANDRNAAYEINPADDGGGTVSITSSFYLLVKHTELLPKTFICPGDKGVTEFKLADYDMGKKSLLIFGT